jgi:RNA polymerase sigma-70 factor, ECF subfamily
MTRAGRASCAEIATCELLPLRARRRAAILCNIGGVETAEPSASRLLQAFAGAIARPREIAGQSPLEGQLLALVAAAKSAWPEVDLDPEDFMRYLAERLDGHDSLEDAVARAQRLATNDVYLACACAKGIARAVSCFDESFLSHMAKHVRKLCDADDDVAEVQQILRTRMLVASGNDKPRILGYAGRGPLGGWLRVAAVRAARDLRRSRGATADPDETSGPASLEAIQPMDPELAVMKARYGHHFRTALKNVLERLPDRERNILAMSVIDGLSTDAIGALYRVNGSTVRRWLGQTRDNVLEGVRSALKADLNIRQTEFDSLMGLVRSQLDLNLSQVLRRPS